tara:strand:- start:530 stop:1087 length:558 start_codon:yes stop_codon:yes gene_type:complete
MIIKSINEHVFATKSLIDQKNIIKDISKECLNALTSKKKIILCGNGGSAADSIHIAAEFVGRFNKKRKSLSAYSLASNQSNLTAISNDFGFDNVFSRQIEGIGNEGDILIALSTSGNSKNIINAINTAKNKKMIVVGFTGKSGGQISKSNCNYCLKIDSENTARIQEMHLLVGHLICEYIDEKII